MNAPLRVCMALVILIAVVRITRTASGSYQPTAGDYIIAQTLIILGAFAGLVNS